MCGNKINPRSKRAQELIKQAFFDLLREKAYKKITITEICQRAGVARRTFYSHYETLEFLVSSILDEILQQFEQMLYQRSLQGIDEDFDIKVSAALFRAFSESNDFIILIKNVDIDEILVQKILSRWLRYIFEEAHPRRGILDPCPEITIYNFTFITYGFLGILKRWILQDQNFAPEEMALLHYRLGSPKIMLQIREEFERLNIKPKKS